MYCVFHMTAGKKEDRCQKDNGLLPTVRLSYCTQQRQKTKAADLGDYTNDDPSTGYNISWDLS